MDNCSRLCQWLPLLSSTCSVQISALQFPWFRKYIVFLSSVYRYWLFVKLPRLQPTGYDDWVVDMSNRTVNSWHSSMSPQSLETKALWSLDKSITLYQSTGSNISEDLILKYRERSQINWNQIGNNIHIDQEF